MNLQFLAEAAADLEDAIDHYQLEAGLDIALDFDREVRRVCSLLLKRPRIGRILKRDVRAFGLTRFPYNLVYRILDDDVVVVAVAHHHRDPKYWRERRLK